MRRALGLLLLLGVAPAALPAQDTTMSRAFELERRGEYAAAAQAYRAILGRSPASAPALLGLERALLPLDRSAEILPQVRAALAALKVSPTSGAIYGVALRAYAATGDPDSMRAVADRWAASAPGDETPYREWGAAALGQRDQAGAMAAYLRGRERLHRPDALAAEVAQLDLARGDYEGALREWLPAIRRAPGYRVSAVATLGQAPDSVRPALLAQLHEGRDLVARRLEAELRARWGDPLGAVQTLENTLPDDPRLAADALQGVGDQLRLVPGPDAREAQGRVLELLADRSTDAERARYRLDAARAYSAAGRRDAARRMLAGIADDKAAPVTVAAGASATLVQVLIGEGKLDEAAERLTAHRKDMTAEDYAGLQHRLVRGYITAGKLGRADSALGADSSVDGLALAGWIRLYRGDIAGAVGRFKQAGPFAGDRDEATQRTSLLALLQPIEADSLPALGEALFALARGDTARAVAGLDQVGGGLPPAKGGAETRLLAGRLAAASGKTADAERLFRSAADPGAPGTAPAAELALSELLLERHRNQEAVALLEHLILTYPGSALIPQTRRRLDEARGAVPQT